MMRAIETGGALATAAEAMQAQMGARGSESTAEGTTMSGIAAVRAEAGTKTDRRSRRTRMQLAAALVTLMRSKPLTAITVKELTELADVNRATFYAHYRDVFDMYTQVKSDVCQMFRELVDAHAPELGRESYAGLLRDLFAYFASNDDTTAIIIGANGDGTFLSDIIEVIRDGGFDAVALYGTPQKAELLRRHAALCNYRYYFLAGGVASMLRSWVHGGCRESVDEMTAMATAYTEALSHDLLNDAIDAAGCVAQNAQTRR